MHINKHPGPVRCRCSAGCCSQDVLHNSAGHPGAAAGWSAATAVCGVGVRIALLHACLCQGLVEAEAGSNAQHGGAVLAGALLAATPRLPWPAPLLCVQGRATWRRGWLGNCKHHDVVALCC
jgi:hypothetical protein